MPLRCSSKLILTPSSWLRKKNHFEEAAGKPTVTFPICASWQGRRIREWKLTDVNQLIKDQTNVVGWRGGEMEHLISSPGYCVLIKFHYWLIFGTICVMIYVKFDKCVTYSDTFFLNQFPWCRFKDEHAKRFQNPLTVLKMSRCHMILW